MDSHSFDISFIIPYNKDVLAEIRKITKEFLYSGFFLILSSLFFHPLHAEDKPAPFFTLQSGVSNDLPATEKDAKQWAKQGYVVMIVKKDSAGYRVWLGKFKTKDEALSAKKKLLARGVSTLLKEETGPFEYEKTYEVEKQNTTPVTTKNTTKNITTTPALTPVSENAVLQAGLYKTKPLADKYKERITNAGYFAYIVAVKKGKRVFYSVRVGASANLTKEELAKKIQGLKFNVEWVQ